MKRTMAVGPVRKIFIQVLAATAVVAQFGWAAAGDWASCYPGCRCTWTDGRRKTTCEKATMSTIPPLHPDTQALCMDNNHIETLENDVFKDRSLIHLQALSLKNCQIKVIEKNAFRGLSIVIEIHLDGNKIRKLDASMFVFTEKLRELYLNDNEIEKIDDGQFANMAFLQQVQLKNNKISKIGQKAFSNSPVLRYINLDYNRLTTVTLKTFENINNLMGLYVSNNPWKCDCHMREFVVWAKSKNLFSVDTVCDQPDYIKGWPWNNITAEKFACKPRVEFIRYDSDADGERLVLMCKVVGDPKPEIYWTFNSRTLTNASMTGLTSEPKYVHVESNDKEYWLNVTVQKVGRQDHGVYKCVTKNSAGISEVNVTIIEDQPFFPFAKSGSGDVWVLLLCLLIGIICALLFIFMVCFLCCRRVDALATKKPANIAVSTNGDISHHILVQSEQQKTLITAVNPVQKPPRKYDSSPHSENGGGTELTELNRNLLDDNSILGTSVAGDSTDDHHSTHSLDQMSYHSQENLLLQDRLRPIPTRPHCPPDLLSFPNRRHQASPVGSCVSSDMDSVVGNRFRALHSPIHSPIYQMHSYAPSYETLPHSRTHSPFSPTSLGPVFSQRSGYVTIPRRPRVPSWSNAPTPTLDASLQTKAEPVYDNLGPRTTADGSSVLSLSRKVAAEGTVGGARPSIPSPLYTSHTLPHKSKLNHVYLSIRENEEPQFHPVRETNGVIRPLPLPFPNQVTSPTDSDARRASWASSKQPETGILKKTTTNEPPLVEDMNTVALSPTPFTKSKVPPKPPPKPKKNGPLFEDEGEDGTEV